MRGGPKPISAALVALLLALGLAACGGSDSASSTTSEASTQGQSEGSANAAGQGSAQSGDQAKSGSGGEDRSSAPSSSAGNFTPRHHADSGGGSAAYRTKGGDNSVQEFGEEDTAEFTEAATALHNFLDARAAGDWGAACRYMSNSLAESIEKLAAGAKQFAGKGCATLLKALINPAAQGAIKAEAEKANVRSLRTKGEQALLIYTASGGTVYVMPMAHEGGNWKVSSLAGSPLS